MCPRLGARPAAVLTSLFGLLLAMATVPMIAAPAQAVDIVVQGTITGFNGVKVQDVFVEANDANGNPLEPRRYAYTGPDGTYSFTVPAAGTYKIDIECWGDYPCAQEYAPEPTTTQVISTTTVVNATLERWGRIAGTVKRNGVTAAWPNGFVRASNDARNYWSSYPEVAVKPDGTFTIEKVAPGTVRVNGDEVWDAEPFLTAQQDVSVPAGGTANIALAVEDWRGANARAVQPDGTPLANIRFNIYSRPLGGGAWDQGIQAGPLLTNADGRMKWRVTDTTREYAICFFDDYTEPGTTAPAERHLSRCLGNAATRDTATLWTPSAASPNVKQDVVLPYAFATVGTPTISGTTNVGSTLTAGPGTWTPAATTTTYEWFRSGTTAAVGTGATYQLVAADVGKTMTVKATGVRTNYVTASKTSAPTAAIGAGTFSATPAPLVSGTTTVGSTLSAALPTWTPAATTTTYQWLRAGAEIPGATSASYVLVAADLGKAMSVRVTGSRAGYTPVTQTSAATTAIGAGAFTTAPAPTIAGTPAVGELLTAAAGTWQPEATTTTFQWLRGTTPIDGATASTYRLVAADAGQAITVTVTGARDGYAATSRTSEPTSTVLDAFTTAPTPTVSGTRAVGSTLTANAGTWAPTPGGTTYQWLRNGVAIPNATARTYRLTSLDGGRRISVRVTASLAGYATKSVTSAATGTILRLFTSAPAPRIVGTTRVRYTLTASLGTWSPTPSTTTYRWYRNGVAIAGATARSYKLTSADRGKRIKVVVKRGRTGYVTTTRTSASTRAIS